MIFPQFSLLQLWRHITFICISRWLPRYHKFLHFECKYLENKRWYWKTVNSILSYFIKSYIWEHVFWVNFPFKSGRSQEKSVPEWQRILPGGCKCVNSVVGDIWGISWNVHKNDNVSLRYLKLGGKIMHKLYFVRNKVQLITSIISRLVRHSDMLLFCVTLYIDWTGLQFGAESGSVGMPSWGWAISSNRTSGFSVGGGNSQS